MNAIEAKNKLISLGIEPTNDDEGIKHFFQAVSSGDLDAVRAWLAFGMSADVEHDHCFPLIRAAEENNSEVIRILCDRGADLNLLDSDGDTALQTALGWKSEEAIIALLDQEKQIDIIKNEPSNLLFRAYRKGEPFLTMLLEAGANPHLAYVEGNSPLGFAADQDEELLKKLLAFEADPNLLVKNQTLLTQKVLEDYPMVIERLIEVGADPNLPNAFGWTPLMVSKLFAVSNCTEVLEAAGAKSENSDLIDIFRNIDDCKLDKIKSLIAATGADVIDETGHNLIFRAVVSGDIETVSYFIEQGVKVAGSGDALSHAISENRIDIATLLLEHMSTPNNSKGQCPALFEAMKTGEFESVKMLLQSGANPNSQTEDFDYVLQKALRASGAKPNCFNETGISPVMSAIELGRPDMLVLLFEFGADPNLADRSGKTPIQFAVEKYYFFDKVEESIQVLLKHGTDLKKVLAEAATNGDVEMMQRALDAQAEVNVELGWSPLMHSAQNGHTEAVELLISAGAMTESRMKGQTAADIAIENGYIELAEMLGGATLAVEPIEEIVTNQSLMTKEEFIAKWGAIEKLDIPPMALTDHDGNLIMKGSLYNVGYFVAGEDPQTMDLNWDAIDNARTFLDPAMKLLNEADCRIRQTEGDEGYYPFFMKIDEGFPIPENFDAFVSKETLEKGNGAYSTEIEVYEGNILFEDIDELDENEKQFQAYEAVNELAKDINEAWEYVFYPDLVAFPVIRGGIDKHDNFVGYISSLVWT